MGVGEASRTGGVDRRRDRRALDDHRPAPEPPPGPQVDRRLQAPRGDAGRRRRDAPQGADVGVHRPPRLDRDPADPRLPRPQPALVRRPRQLHARHPRAADLPRDRLRLDQARPAASTSPSRPPPQTDEEGFELLLGLGFPFAQEGRPGGKSPEEIAAEEEEQRKEEARLRAEAEQAALEQLKEENPEAYEKPERRRRGRGRGRRRSPSSNDGERRGVDGKDLTTRQAGSRARSSRPATTTAAASAAAPARSTASSASAGSACARPPTRATSPA